MPRSTVTWYFEDEATQATDDLLDRVVRDGAIVPPLWRLDVANVFQSSLLYDACYLELAQQRGLPLATLDQDLRGPGQMAGSPLLGI